MNSFSLSFKGHHLKLGINTCVMGILNVTPDSFSDGGRFFKASQAIDQAHKMVEQGADIIDIGGESTRPYSDAVPAEEEIRRVVPVIRELAKTIPVPISIDTNKALVAEQAIAAGASIVNDVSAMEMDTDMARVVAENKVPVILMHMRGLPRTMQVNPHYDDVVSEIIVYLENVIRKAEEQGIHKSMIIADPGIGFGKTIEHNFRLLKHLSEFKRLDVPILVGSSRKAFIRKTLGAAEGKDLSREIEIGTQATVSAAVIGGAHIVRVHDVASTVATVKILDAMKRA
ncbi:MAG: dihydropteroate synthase [Desulfobacteraceae bacterium]|jgi:dihydropteroate synthase